MNHHARASLRNKLRAIPELERDAFAASLVCVPYEVRENLDLSPAEAEELKAAAATMIREQLP